MTIEEFTAELVSYMESLLIGATSAIDWQSELHGKVYSLAKKHLNKKPPALFVLGEDSLCPNDVGIQVDIKKSLTLPELEYAVEDEKVNVASVLQDLRLGLLKHRNLESKFRPAKSVELRRKHFEQNLNQHLFQLPFEHYDFSWVNGACCENIIGYVPIPTGIAGPLTINNETLYIPMSTTEGALIASTNRGCKAINECGGIYSVVFKDGMSRAPAVSFESLREANNCFKWLNSEESFQHLKDSFETTSSYAQLTKIEATLDGRLLFIRFVATTGDAMGMNMVTKGVSEAMNVILKQFPLAKLETISGNMCVDKKASAVNWIFGRGKSVCAEATILSDVIKSVLKTDVDKLVRLGAAKLQHGALNSVSIGGSNAHAANVVAAIFLATGQDAAQVVSSCMCSTKLTKTEEGNLNITCTMNCLEVGTVGGGTILSPQQACLKMLGCCGPSKTNAGSNSARLATIICAAVLAGELSLLASQCTGDLVRSHLRLNRSNRDLSSGITTSRSLLSIPEESNFLNNLTINQNNGAKLNGRKLSGNLSSKFTRPSVSALALKHPTTPATKVVKKVFAKCDQSFT